ncbi:MAG: hypothetical protein U1E17_21805 [Geminicoccaceae bacterium]
MVGAERADRETAGAFAAQAIRHGRQQVVGHPAPAMRGSDVQIGDVAMRVPRLDLQGILVHLHAAGDEADRLVLVDGQEDMVVRARQLVVAMARYLVPGPAAGI